MRAIQSLYAGCEAKVKVGKKHSEWFRVDQGVRQGGMLSKAVHCVLDTAIYKGGKIGLQGGVRLRKVVVLHFAEDKRYC